MGVDSTKLCAQQPSRAAFVSHVLFAAGGGEEHRHYPRGGGQSRNKNLSHHMFSRLVLPSPTLPLRPLEDLLSHGFAIRSLS